MTENTYTSPIEQKDDKELFEKLNKKRKLYKSANAVGFTVLIAFIAQYFLGTISSVFIQILSAFGVQSVMDINFVSFLNEMIVVLTFVVPFAICAIVVNGKVSKTVPTKSMSPFMFFGATFVAFGFNSICNIANGIFSSILTMFGMKPVSQSLDGFKGTEDLLISILCTAILPALIEEFAFRGVVLGIFRKNMSDTAAIILSAFIFGLVHGNLVQLPFAIGMGLVFGVVTVHTNSIWPAVVAHFLNNFCAVLLSSGLVENMSRSGANIVSILFYVVSTALAILGVIMLLKKDKNIFKFSKKNKTFSDKKSIGIAISSVGMILAIIAYAINIVLLQTGFFR